MAKPCPRKINRVDHLSLSLFKFKARLILLDFAVSFTLVWLGSLIEIFVFKVLRVGHDSRDYCCGKMYVLSNYLGI
jgi:hypothetical protein